MRQTLARFVRAVSVSFEPGFYCLAAPEVRSGGIPITAGGTAR
jgi:hypothetical protein